MNLFCNEFYVVVQYKSLTSSKINSCDSFRETSRAVKGGQKYAGRGVRNSLAARGCRGKEGPVEQFEGGNTTIAVLYVEAGGGGRLSRWTGNPRL